MNSTQPGLGRHTLTVVEYLSVSFDGRRMTGESRADDCPLYGDGRLPDRSEPREASLGCLGGVPIRTSPCVPRAQTGGLFPRVRSGAVAQAGVDGDRPAAGPNRCYAYVQSAGPVLLVAAFSAPSADGLRPPLLPEFRRGHGLRQTPVTADALCRDVGAMKPRHERLVGLYQPARGPRNEWHRCPRSHVARDHSRQHHG